MTSVKKLQAKLDAAKKRLHEELLRAYPVGTKVIVEVRQNRFSHGTIAGEGCWWQPEYLRMTNDRTGKSFSRHHTSVRYA